ncbi:hypothetical protein Y032_0150g2743 [Ancylostoma ceylanicum]|nr:hypothetical protein Y032_0150g2743 [Ancylostoma ceylanicum]
MKRDCASTCQLCNIVESEESSNANATNVYLPNGERFRQNRLRTLKKNSTRVGQDCEENEGRKCVFPDEKKITTTTPLAKKVKADRSQRNRSATGVAPNKVAVVALPKEANRLVNRKSFTPSHTNKKLIEYMRNKTRTTATTDTATTVVYNVSVVPSTESYEVRKVKLEELMNSTDNLPNITTAEIESFTVSLSKTLIKGKCYDEYTYCREFSSLCVDPTYGDVMARHCTLTCKRCDDVEIEEEYEDDCFDITPDCRSHLELCGHSKYKQLMKDSCAKSCNLCAPVCKDRHKNCLRFVDDGFCSDEMYTNDERKYLCGQTCKLC